MAEKKLFAGPRLKGLRRELGLTQARMAAELGVSASYFNLMERNQRPITAQVLIALAETFEIDLARFAATPDQSLLLALREAAADPALEAIGLDVHDLKDLADAHPRAAEALVRLHQSYQGKAGDLADLAARLDMPGGAPSAVAQPAQDVRDVVHGHNNYFPDLEEAADVLRDEARLRQETILTGASAHLLQVHGVRTKIMPFDVMRGALRRYDRHSRRLLLSEMLDLPARRFQVLVQIAHLELGELMDEMQMEPGLGSKAARKLYRIGLANYFAAAALMPYAPFLEAAETLRYDLDILRHRFGVSFEQLCHRLTTLQKPGARGVGFFMLRADRAGNVSKRFGGQVFPFSRTGGTCAQWDMWRAFAAPGRLITQSIEMPDGARYFTLSRTVRRTGSGAPREEGQLVVTIGCPADQAEKLVYKGHEGEEDPMPVGLNCRLCDRPQCTMRAFPPLQKRLYVDENRRSASAFPFSP